MTSGTNNLIIRPAITTEYRVLTIIAIQSKAYWGYDDSFIQQCIAELSVTPQRIEQRDNLYQVARVNNTIVGFYLLVTTNKELFELEALFVLPTFIGKGIGKNLFNHAMKLANSLSAKEVKIVADPYAKEFYLNVGAVLVGEEASGSIAGRTLPVLQFSTASQFNSCV